MDTFNDVFSRLREHFVNQSEERKQAVENWILFNQEMRKDNLEIFENVISEEEGEFAMFNLRKE